MMDEKRALIQTLTDAGCGAALQERFVSLVQQGREKEAFILLAGHRRTLLEHCHAAERKIECLDYLVYQMKQRAKRNKEDYLYGRKADADSGVGQNFPVE